ncbi:helix-turn-helix domain-containing protein [Streptomyces sp. NPDC059575]|uniref:helix-turn-helix domain-containing protein n=1 Tax=Streptomyces sp. NPDC059575 TaxID=3346872 RepID=UPI00369E5960
MTGDGKSVIDEYESFPRGAQELAAARLAQSAARALRDGLKAGGKSAREIADLLGLTESAVSQVLNSDGNVRIATLARYLRAMGYKASVEISPASESSPPIPTPVRRRRALPEVKGRATRENSVTVSVSRCNVTDGNVVAQALLLVLPPRGSVADEEVKSEPTSETQWHVLDAGISEGRSAGSWSTSESSHARRSTSSLARPNDRRGSGAVGRGGKR